MTIRRTDLDGGLTVVTEAMPDARSASFGCWVRIGGRDEPGEILGVSHFLEHLMFKGTTRRSGRELSEAIESVGGELNAHTGHEHTAYYARVPASAADFGLDLLVDVLTAPAFDDADVESERQVILEELSQAEDDGEDRVHTLAQEALWGEHPLGREVLGTAETIDAMTTPVIRGFLDRHYHPGRLVLVAAGDVDHDRVLEAADRFDRPAGDVSERIAPDPDRPVTPTRRLDRPLEQSHLAIAWAALSATDPDRWAQTVCNQIVGGGLSSRLFQTVREERGLAYSVFSSTAAFSDAGSLTTYAGTSPDRVNEVQQIVLDIIAEIAENGVTEREWSVARGYLEGVSLLGLEDSGSVMARHGSNLALRGEIVPIDDQIEGLRAVTPDDVHRVARSIFGREPVVCTVGPSDRGR